MERQLKYMLTNNFEDFSHTTDEGMEFWIVRDLQKLLGYNQWRNFELVIQKTQTACVLRYKSKSEFKTNYFPPLL